MLNIQIHNSKRIWKQYILPRRLTIGEPAIYRWLFWVFSIEK